VLPSSSTTSSSSSATGVWTQGEAVGRQHQVSFLQNIPSFLVHPANFFNRRHKFYYYYFFFYICDITWTLERFYFWRSTVTESEDSWLCINATFVISLWVGRRGGEVSSFRLLEIVWNFSSRFYLSTICGAVKITVCEPTVCKITETKQKEKNKLTLLSENF
jgi:hypothetical protein